MQFDFTDDQRAFRAKVRAFLQRELTPDIWAQHRDTG
jgi:alkylation response protein AidB-like acyl-CoA dehydrogenase